MVPGLYHGTAVSLQAAKYSRGRPRAAQIEKYSSAVILRFPFIIAENVFIGISARSATAPIFIPFSTMYCLILSPSIIFTS